MTIDELKAAIPKLQALADGKEVESRHRSMADKDPSVWGYVYAELNETIRMIFHPDIYETRINAEPKYRPWNMEEVPVGKVLKSKATGYRVLILSAQPSSTTLSNGRGTPHAELFEHWTMDDGSVCGMAVGE